MNTYASIYQELQDKFEQQIIAVQPTTDEIPTCWITKKDIRELLRYLKQDITQPFGMLYDLTAIDERTRNNRPNQPPSDFTVVYHLLSFERNQDVRLKVPLQGDAPSLPTVTDLWPAANWYEREVWDMFGLKFDDHPHLQRILMPPTWQGHPLRKEHPARATEMEPFQLPDDKQTAEQEALAFRPEEWGWPVRVRTPT